MGRQFHWLLIFGCVLVVFYAHLSLPPSPPQQRAHTYPAPSFQYSRPPTTPYYMPPPSTTQLRTPPYTGTHTPGPSTQSALDTIHSMVSRSTTYRDHFTPRTHTQLQPSSKADYLVFSMQSHRPWTNESRGKYNTDFPTGPPLLDPLSDDEEEAESEVCEGEKPLTQVQEEEEMLPEESSAKQDDDKTLPTDGQSIIESASAGGERCAEDETTGGDKQEADTSEASTQTEEFYFGERNSALNSPQSSPHYTSYSLPPATGNTPQPSSEASSPRPGTSAPSRNPIDSLTAKLYKLPLLDPGRGTPSSKPAAVTAHATEEKLGSGSSSPFTAAGKQDLEYRRSFSQPSVSHKLQALSKVQRSDSMEGSSQLRTPRTVESSRKMMEVFNRFSRSESMKRFNQHFRELTPDLRQFSIRQGKRHIIHGTHAYYYH